MALDIGRKRGIASLKNGWFNISSRVGRFAGSVTRIPFTRDFAFSVTKEFLLMNYKNKH